MDESLARFLQAQEYTYEVALQEIRAGCKYSHWMWYVFPILWGLGHSEMARLYGLRGADEAKAFIHHPVLGKRLVEITQALLHLDGLTAEQIFGSTDAWKLQCCMTLFQIVAPEEKVFGQVLDKYYQGQHEYRTLNILGKGK
ncbi:MAG: DUF1810 domain-containing protein [Eubacteriales bacterium]|nr:DUF1810 domain-containing protein [Eubacteriales bacterium]